MPQHPRCDVERKLSVVPADLPTTSESVLLAPIFSCHPLDSDNKYFFKSAREMISTMRGTRFLKVHFQAGDQLIVGAITGPRTRNK